MTLDVFLHLLALFPHDFLTHSSGDIVEVRRSVFHNHWNGFSRHVRSAKKTTSTSTHRLLQRNSAKKHITITCLFCLFAPALAIPHKNQKDNNNKSFGGAFSPFFFQKGHPLVILHWKMKEATSWPIGSMYGIYVYLHPCKCPECVPWAPPTGTSIKAWSWNMVCRNHRRCIFVSMYIGCIWANYYHS